MLKAIFNVCKRNSVKIDKQAHRIKKIERHLNISTSDEESDEDTFENPFEAYELAQRAAASASHTRAAAPSHGYAEEDNEEEEEEEEYNEEDEGSEGDGAASEGSLNFSFVPNSLNSWCLDAKKGERSRGRKVYLLSILLDM
uniref:Uncharacterized protein n=1 Tax=Arundo donax TaxID=35708 RepID=A0A0A8Z9R6_ARUDO